MKKNNFSRSLVPVIIVVGLLSACGDEKPDVLVLAAKTSLAKNDPKNAIIQIKNALQADPNLAEARFLLGSTLLSTGDFVAAEVELDKARGLKYSEDLVVPQLAKSLLLQGKNKKLTDDFSKTELQSNASRASLQISLSKAYAAQGLAQLSQNALNSALAYEPENADALILQVRNLAGKSDFSGALALADVVIAKNPKNPDIWKTKGDIFLYGKRDADSALFAYKKSIEIKKDYVQGYFELLTILFQQEKIEEASKELDNLKKIASTNPQTKYFEVQLAYQKKDFVAARALVQELLKITPDNPMSLQSAGLVEFQLNSFVQAETYLSKAVGISPNLPLARRLLILTYLRVGKPDKALAALTTGLSQEPVDTALYSIAGEVFVQNGDVKKAGEYFAKASKLDPKDGRKRTSLALVHLISGDASSAFTELGDIASTDKGISADLALISAHLRRQDFDKALKAIDGLEKKQPTNPLAFNLRGKIQLSKKDYAAARKSFESALVVSPSYFPAIASLAALDVFEKKPEEAKKRFDNILSKDPKNNQALLALAELRARAGGTKEEVAESLNAAISANPSEIGPRILLIDFYLRNKDNKAAHIAAQSAVSVLPDSLEAMDALGRTQLATGDTNQAISTYTKLVGLQPKATQPLMSLASANLAAKNMDAVEQNLNKVLELKPGYLEAQINLIRLNTSAEKYKNALSIAQSVQRQRPKEVMGYVLEGDINVAQKKWDEALTAYRAGMKQTGSLEPATKIHAALNISNNKNEADKFSASWMKDHPRDVGFMTYIADISLATKDMQSAEKMYNAVVQIQPENAIAYNNLAWVEGQLNKGTAVANAEKANKLMPNQPAFMDTLANLLADKGDYIRATELQKKAVDLQADNPVFKFNLAKIYIKSGDKKQAKVLLDELAKLGDKFTAHAEVAVLIKSL